MPVSWPTNVLPLPYEAVEIQNNSNSIRTQMESGYTRQRKRFDALTRTYSVKWMLKELQAALWQSFVKHKLKNGNLDFTITLRSGDFGLQEVVARIVGGNYSVGYTDGLFVISATLEVQDAEVVPEEVYDFILGAGITIADVFTMRDILHELVHVTLPEELPHTGTFPPLPVIPSWVNGPAGLHGFYDVISPGPETFSGYSDLAPSNTVGTDISGVPSGALLSVTATLHNYATTGGTIQAFSFIDASGSPLASTYTGVNGSTAGASGEVVDCVLTVPSGAYWLVLHSHATEAVQYEAADITIGYY